MLDAGRDVTSAMPASERTGPRARHAPCPVGLQLDRTDINDTVVDEEQVGPLLIAGAYMHGDGSWVPAADRPRLWTS